MPREIKWTMPEWMEKYVPFFQTVYNLPNEEKIHIIENYMNVLNNETINNADYCMMRSVQDLIETLEAIHREGYLK